MTIEHLHRLDDATLLAITQLFFCSLTDHWIHVDRIQSLTIWMLIQDTTNHTNPARKNSDIQYVTLLPLLNMLKFLKKKLKLSNSHV